MKNYLSKPIVVKIGGSTLGNHDTTLEDLVALQQRGITTVVVHGGGKLVTEWLERQGVSVRFEKGLRVTDAQSLPVVIAVLAGLVNKELVAALESLGGRAIGLSGIDGRFIEARIKDPSLGYVGEVVRVNLDPLKPILEGGYMPIIAPLGYHSAGESREPSPPLNINADTAAAEIAAALHAERLILLTDVAGVCDREGKPLSRLSPPEARNLMASGVISGGMTPKVEACLRALSTISSTHIIDGRARHALLESLENRNSGTRIE